MEKIIKAAVERGASDLHIKAGDVFRARINGKLVPLTKQRLTPDQTKAIALKLISADHDRAPGGFGRPDGAPDQVHGHVDEAVRVDLGPAAAAGLPRRRLLGVQADASRGRPGHGLGRGGADVEADDDAGAHAPGTHGYSSPDPRSMSLAGTWMRSTGRSGWPRRARSRAAATRPTS